MNCHTISPEDPWWFCDVQGEDAVYWTVLEPWEETGETRMWGAREGAGKCVCHRVCTSAASNPAHPSLKDEGFGSNHLGKWSFGRISEASFERVKKGLEEEFTHSLANYCVLTASYMPEPVLVSALCAIHSAVAFMEPLERGDRWHTQPKEININYFPLRRAMCGENKQDSVTVVVCRAFFKLNGQEKRWVETWMTRIDRQPFEGNFWSEGIAAPKYKEGCMAGSRRWGKCGKQGQVMWRLAGCDRRWVVRI